MQRKHTAGCHQHRDCERSHDHRSCCSMELCRAWKAEDLKLTPEGLQDQHRCKGFSLLHLSSLEQPPAVCFLSQLLPLRNINQSNFCSAYIPGEARLSGEDTSLWPGLSPIDTIMPDVLLMLWNCLLNLAVEHWFGCCATDPGFSRDIGTGEVWLIDWLICHQTDLEINSKFYCQSMKCA